MEDNPTSPSLQPSSTDKVSNPAGLVGVGSSPSSHRSLLYSLVRDLVVQQGEQADVKVEGEPADFRTEFLFITYKSVFFIHLLNNADA